MLSFSHNVEFVFFFSQCTTDVLVAPGSTKTENSLSHNNNKFEHRTAKNKAIFLTILFQKQFNLLRYHIQKTNFTGTNFGSPSLFTSEIKRVSFAFSELVSCTTLILVGAEFKRSVENCLNKILLFACQSCNFYTSKSYISLAIYLSKRQ